MRILMTTDTIGGVWTLTRELTQQLLDRGHGVALVSFGHKPSSEQEAWCRRIAAKNKASFWYRSTDVPLEWMQENLYAFTSGLKLLVDTANEFNADLLHTHQFCWGAFPGELPRVITAHSDVLSWSACCRPEGLPDSDWLTRYVSLVQTGLDGANAVVAPTSWMRDALRVHFDVPCRFSVIPNGRTVPSADHGLERKLQAVSAGRLWDQAKGIQTLLDIDSPLPILVAGEDTFESASVVTRSLQALGTLNEAELFKLFHSSSIYIASSVYEPFGLAPLEAALCGCAVVAQNISSLREVWADSALFYDTADELAGVLRDLTNSRELLRAMQGKAHARAQHFSASRMTDQYLELYESLLKLPNAKSLPAQELATHAT